MDPCRGSKKRVSVPVSVSVSCRWLTPDEYQEEYIGTTADRGSAVDERVETEADKAAAARRKEKVALAREIRSLYKVIKTSSMPLDQVWTLLEKLRSRSALGHSVLLTLLRTDRRCESLDLVLGKRSQDKPEKNLYWSAVKSNSTSPDLIRMDELPNITVSSADFLTNEDLNLGMNLLSPETLLGLSQDNSHNASGAQELPTQPLSVSSQDMVKSNGVDPYERTDPMMMLPPVMPQVASPAMLKPKSNDPVRRARYNRTAEILSKSGLLDITMKTAELMRKNQKLNKEIMQLRKDTNAFVESVLSNPENVHLRAMMHNPRTSLNSPRLMISPDMNFHVLKPGGGIHKLRTVISPPPSTLDNLSTKSMGETISTEVSSLRGSLKRQRSYPDSDSAQEDDNIPKKTKISSD